MSLATRCTSCGTIFRVVQDQLKVSEGWVRCGRCDAVFNASSELFDLEREAPPDWQPIVAPPTPEQPVAADTGGDSGFASDDERRWSESMTAQLEGAASEPGRPANSAGATSSSPAFAFGAARGERADDEPAAHGTDLNAELADPADHAALRHDDGPLAPAASQAVPASDDSPWQQRGSAPAGEPAPGFVRQARRDAVWQSRRARTILAIAALLLIVALTLQALQQFSELAAARWPALRPGLVGWCGLTGCSLAAPHRIDDIVVESTALSPAPPGLRLAVTLRNRAAYPVSVPSLDLSMTDPGGKLIARRALSPRDLSVTAAAIEAGSDLPLQVLLSAGSERVSGYTVEIFYP